MDKKQKILFGVGTIAVALTGYFIYEHMTYVTTDNAQIEAHSVMLAPKVGGFIVEVKVVEGQKVKKGDLLVRIDDRDYQNAYTQAKGELTSLVARKNDSERNFQRISSLYKNGAVSQQQFDASQTSYSDIKSKSDVITAQVSQAQLNLDNTQIKAPFDGVVAKKSVEEGQLAAPGVPLIGFVESGERWVTANFKETEIESIKLGHKAHISVDAVSKRTFEGTVVSISSATGATFSLLPPDNATGNFTKVVQRVPVKIKLENLSEEDVSLLRAGLSADVKVSKH
jgi:membrane fusion protein (multidrug efflux system)